MNTSFEERIKGFPPEVREKLRRQHAELEDLRKREEAADARLAAFREMHKRGTR